MSKEEVARQRRLEAFGTEDMPAEETVSVANVNTPAPDITEDMADESTERAAETEEAVSVANVNTPAPTRTEDNSGN